MSEGTASGSMGVDVKMDKLRDELKRLIASYVNASTDANSSITWSADNKSSSITYPINSRIDTDTSSGDKWSDLVYKPNKVSPNKRVKTFGADDDVDGEFAAVRDKLRELGINMQGKMLEVTINEYMGGLKRVECRLFGGSLILSVKLYMRGDRFHNVYTVGVVSTVSVAAEQIIEFWNIAGDLMAATE